MPHGAPADVTTGLSIEEKKGGDMKAFPVGFLVGAALLLQLGPAWPAETIKIAVSVGLSGPNAIYGEGQLNAFKAAADIVNARGGVLGGKKMEIVPMDNKGTPQE